MIFVSLYFFRTLSTFSCTSLGFAFAGTTFVLTVGTLFYVGGLVLLVCLVAGAVVFALAALGLRSAFRRASGGLSFKVGGLRG